MDYQKLQDCLEQWSSIYKRTDPESGYYKKDKATEEEILETEARLGAVLPKELRNFFLEYSKALHFYADLPEGLELPEELNEIFSAYIMLSLDEVVNAEAARRSWAKDCFNNMNDEYDKVWHNKFGIMKVPNGDIIALDTGKNPANPPVVYLSHDDGEGHGAVLGKTFYKYLEAIAEIGFCGNEDWQMLPFIENMEYGINPACKNAGVYKKLLEEYKK